MLVTEGILCNVVCFWGTCVFVYSYCLQLWLQYVGLLNMILARMSSMTVNSDVFTHTYNGDARQHLSSIHTSHELT